MTIRWGIIGCGDVCEVKSGPGFQQAEGSELVAVMRRNGRLAQDFARRHGVSKWYDDVDVLINDGEVDAVYIATPPGSHVELAQKVARAGKPCYIEKPMARNAAECQAIIDAFNARRVPLFVGYYRRALPRFVTVKDLIDTGEIGKVERVNYIHNEPTEELDSSNLPWRLQAEQSGGGLLLDVGCHAIDIIDYLTGPMNWIRATAERRNAAYDVEDFVTFRWRTKEGVIGNAEWDFNADESKNLITIQGDDGEIAVSCFGDDPIVVTKDGEETTFEAPNPTHIQQPLIQQIVNELSGRGKCASTGESALRCSEVMDKALKHYYDGREDNFWERPASWPGVDPQAKKLKPAQQIPETPVKVEIPVEDDDRIEDGQIEEEAVQ